MEHQQQQQDGDDDDDVGGQAISSSRCCLIKKFKKCCCCFGGYDGGGGGCSKKVSTVARCCRLICATICQRLKQIVLKCVKNRLLYLLLFSIAIVFLLSRFMSFTLFHYFSQLDPVTKRLGDSQTDKLIVNLNKQRIQTAIDYFQQLHADKPRRDRLNQLLQPAHGKDLAITIVTIDRLQSKFSTRPSYFTQTVARLLQKVEQYYQREDGDDDDQEEEEEEDRITKLSIELTFCVVDFLPVQNREVEFVRNSTGLQVVMRFDNGTIAPANYLQLTNRFEREKQDYVFCMNSTRSRQPRFTLVLEDDAPPMYDYFNILENLLKQSRQNHHGSDYNMFNLSSSVLFLKLFHPDSLLQFHALDAERIPQLLALATLMTLLSFLVMVLLANRRSICILAAATTSTATNQRFHPLHFAEISHIYQRDFWPNFAQIFIYFALMALVIGRPNVVFHYQQSLVKHLNMVSLVPAPSCCTPAIIYPQQSLPIVVDFLDKTPSHERYAKDGILDDLRHSIESAGKKAWLVQPNLHSHVGQFSVVRHKDNNNYRHFLGIQY